MPERLRCAVIGTGGFGLDHLNSLLHCPRATAVAVAETNPERLKEAADRFKISRAYADYHDLLDQPDIDAVTIAVPNYLHARIAIDALQARKHVLLEKPMAMNAKEAAKIVEAAKKMRRSLMVAQNFRFNRHTQVAKAIVERGDLGQVALSRPTLSSRTERIRNHPFVLANRLAQRRPNPPFRQLRAGRKEAAGRARRIAQSTAGVGFDLRLRCHGQGSAIGLNRSRP